MHATVYSESFIKNGHISNRASNILTKSDGKIAPQPSGWESLSGLTPASLLVSILLIEAGLYSPPYEGELVELDPFLWSDDMLGKWLGEWRGGRGEGTGGGGGGWGSPPPLAMKLRACSASY